MPSSLRDAPSGPLAPPSAMPPGVIQVADLATLALLAPSTRVSDGALAYVQRLKRCFQLDRPSTEAPLEGQRVAATGGGIWRSTTYFSPQASPWSSRTDWHINAVTGNVEGDGSAGDPINSWLELSTRLNDHQLEPGTTISLHSSLTERIDASRLIPDPSTNLLITGEPGATVDVTGTVATWTPAVYPAGGEAILLTSAAVANWTPYQQRRIRFLDGAAIGALCIASYANPAGAGVNVTRVTQPCLLQSPFPVNKTPAVGASFVIETLPTILGYTPPAALSAGYYNGEIIVRGVSFPQVASPNTVSIRGGLVWLWGCTAGDLDLQGIEDSNIQACAIGTLTGSGLVLRCQSSALRNSSLHNASIGCSGSMTMYYDLVQHGCTLVNGHYTIGYFGSFDNPSGAGLSLSYPASSVKQDHNVYGKGNSTYGLIVGSGATWVYDPLPSITGATADLQLGGANFAWGGGPFVNLNKLCGVVPI